jgi:hypothetical protein
VNRLWHGSFLGRRRKSGTDPDAATARAGRHVELTPQLVHTLAHPRQSQPALHAIRLESDAIITNLNHD